MYAWSSILNKTKKADEGYHDGSTTSESSSCTHLDTVPTIVPSTTSCRGSDELVELLRGCPTCHGCDFTLLLLF